jgi:histidinol-phosphate aminotransferase
MGLSPDEVLDFSVCSNPFGPPPGVKEILDTIAIDHYPDSEATELRWRLSERLGVAPEEILAGSGSVEIIRLIALTYFRHGDSVLTLEPTFGEYEVACRIVGSEVFKQWGEAEKGFALRVEETVDLIGQRRPRGVFVCNPNNPTGQYLSRREVEAVLDACGDGLLVLDEAYISFVDDGWSAIDLIHRGNLLVLRSMTKDYALAGLRLGYGIADRGIVDGLRRARSPWNVNAVAQKVGCFVLSEQNYLERCKENIKRAKEFIVSELCRLGFPPLPSRANFFLVRVGDGKEFRSALLQRGILVRDCTSFGLPEYIRIAPRTMAECQKLIATIEGLKHEGA